MIRNRYFHAAKAYPLFVISENAETKQEKILTKLMLILIKEFFVSEEFMS
jgi:hypothetical protein